MTQENWNIVALIIIAIITATATLIAPSLAEIVKWRISQPKANPTDSHPKPWRVKMVSLLNSSRFNWAFFLVGSLIVLFIVVKSIIAETPPTRWSIFIIAFGITLIHFQTNNLVRGIYIRGFLAEKDRLNRRLMALERR